MDVIKSARELGKAIQADERYAVYVSAKDANDKDETLQKLIGEFNITRQNLQLEMGKPETEKNEEKLQSLNADLQKKYTEVMSNEHMADFTIAKDGMDKLLNEINAIIGMCCDGEDPDTCEIPEHNCSGSCESCGGCH